MTWRERERERERKRERRSNINNKSVDNKHGNKNFYFDVFLIRINFNKLYIQFNKTSKIRIQKYSYV
jgi:hypothetical protein